MLIASISSAGGFFSAGFSWVGGNRSKERDRKSELVLRSKYQIFEWDRNNSDRNFYNVVRYIQKGFSMLKHFQFQGVIISN